MNTTQTTKTVEREPESRDCSESAMVAGAQAHRMLTEAKMPESGIDRFCVLANDIFALANDEFEGDAVSAARELQTRIGGLQNLKSYTDCLLVGNHKFGL